MISVIVPVYNVEKYLSRCLDSILNQTYKDFEIVLVDDGSKDSSGKICDEYASKSEKIKVLHCENGGLSNARNKGCDASKGEYITFVDSDDLIHTKYLEILIRLIESNRADISCCNFNFFDDNSIIDYENIAGYQNCYDGMTATAEMLYGKMHGSSACAILLKREIAINNRFMPGKYHEDDLISFKYFISAQKVAYTSQKLYYYYQRVGSIMHSPFGKIALDELDAADYIVENCKQYDKNVKNAALVKKFCNYKDVLITYPNLRAINIETYCRIKKDLRTISSKIYKYRNVPKRIKISAFINYFFGINCMIFFSERFGL